MSLSATASDYTAAYQCGPVQLQMTYDDPVLRQALDALLSQYDAPWPAGESSFSITVEHGPRPVDLAEPAGNYLHSYRLHVDRRGTHLISRSNVGVWMDLNEAARKARIIITDTSDPATMIEEVEQQLVLVLARAWALAGWTPLHAGVLVPPGGNHAVLVCAPSGVGKTTVTTAMLLHGWQTLGDDKVLLRQENGIVTARGLSRRFHLHPSLSQWFPQLGDITRWPHYSRWTEKRMARMNELWPRQLLPAAIPKAVVQLLRAEDATPLSVKPVDTVRAMKIVLNQIVLPGDARDARPLVACASAMMRQLRGAEIFVGHNAFADKSIASRIETALRGLLS